VREALPIPELGRGGGGGGKKEHQFVKTTHASPARPYGKKKEEYLNKEREGNFKVLTVAVLVECRRMLISY
jgi:hypothetical protein